MPKQSKTPTLPTQRRLARTKTYDGGQLARRLQQLLQSKNESYREAALRAGLDHQALGRILREKMRPMVQTCILLADHFEINPNELLELAGHPRLKIFDIQMVSADKLPVEAVAVAKDIARITNANTRLTVSEAIRTLLKKYFES